MSKRPLLHFKFDANNISQEVVNNFYQFVKRRYGKNYRILITPFDLTVPNKDTTILNFDGIDYTYEEIEKAIENYKESNVEI